MIHFLKVLSQLLISNLVCEVRLSSTIYQCTARVDSVLVTVQNRSSLVNCQLIVLNLIILKEMFKKICHPVASYLKIIWLKNATCWSSLSILFPFHFYIDKCPIPQLRTHDPSGGQRMLPHRRYNLDNKFSGYQWIYCTMFESGTELGFSS